MMQIRRYDTIHYMERDLEFVPRRVTPFRAVVAAACRMALYCTSYRSPLSSRLNVGIALLTDYGERFPNLWLEIAERGQKLRPAHFESSIHNSAAGYAAIMLGLQGPQIVLVGGDIHLAAKLQLLSGRSRLMIVCIADVGSAECYVLEAE